MPRKNPPPDTATPGSPPAAPDSSSASPAAVIGIGASAGGLSALKQLLPEIPADAGLAIVVVVHLAADYESHLAELLQPFSRAPVVQVDGDLPLEPNRVYIIPPNANLEAIDSHLRLTTLERRREDRAPIDHFFRTLAATHDGASIGVILTGTGSDGTLGLKEIRAKGGLTIVQSPAEAEFDGMPQSAISTGIVDRVLTLREMPDVILSYVRTEPRIPLAREEGEELDAREGSLLQKLFAHLRARTGRDFANYKRSTILRRIGRRMQLLRLEKLEDYLGYVREHATEVQSLADDLLITVTNFFRDPEVFDSLRESVIPKLFEGAGDGDPIRVWSVGCATGEEAYSIAILLLEEAGRRDVTPRLQVFASDLHERSLSIAREGFYSGDIEIDVSPERIKRFFVKEDGGYRIRKEVRELVVFAPHNLLSDPPFSRLGLIICRNLLIYLKREVQRDVTEIFHYALKPDGFLVLGTSETVDGVELFHSVHKKLCIYQRRNGPAPEPRLPVFPLTRTRLQVDRGSQEAQYPPVVYGSLHQQMVERYAPPSVLVNPEDRVVHLSEHAGRYLLHPGGELTASIHKLVRQELRIELRSVLHLAREKGAPIRSKLIPLRINGGTTNVVIHARPALEPLQEGFALIIFDEWETTTDQSRNDTAVDGSRLAEMGAELDLTRQRLQAIIEEYETSQEEMKASNEELQSTNEELRSTMEELETSKEELQSMNEELQTVNQENRHKVEELAQLSGDLQNLLAATDIATLFLDRELRIMRFTPKVGELFSVRMTDRARPISELTHRLGYDELLTDAQAVLDRLIPVEREVKDHAGRWYLTRVLPYRSTQDRIEGVVLTFVDITARRKAEEELRELAGTLEERVRERTRELMEQEERVRRLAATLSIAEQQERSKLSQLLHDDLQQLLYGVQMKLAHAREKAAAGDAEVLIEQTNHALDLLQEAIATTRRLTVDLSPPVLEGEGLTDALRWLQSHMHDLHGLSVELRARPDADVQQRDIQVLLFQVVRELLFNVAKHAGTERASIDVWREGQDVWISVSDDGRGFEPDVLSRVEPEPAGFGLFSIRERLRFQGGDLQIDSHPGGGTRMRIRAPREVRSSPVRA